MRLLPLVVMLLLQLTMLMMTTTMKLVEEAETVARPQQVEEM